MSPTELFANNFTTKLAQACLATDLTVYLQDALASDLQGSGEFRLLLQNPAVLGQHELVTGSMGASTTTVTVTRGTEGSNAQAFPLGALVSQVLTEGGLGQALQNIAAAAENVASTAVGAEATRAQAAEAAKASIASLTSETSRAQTAEALSAQKASNLSDLADAGSSRVNLHVPALTPAACVATANLALSGLQTVDGYTLVAGDLVLLTAQTTSSQNGLWTAVSGSWTRPTEMATGVIMKARTAAIIQGSSHRGETWLLQTNSSITVDTSSQTWVSQTPVSVGKATSTDGTDSLPVPSGVGLEMVIATVNGVAGLQDIRFNGVSL